VVLALEQDGVGHGDEIPRLDREGLGNVAQLVMGLLLGLPVDDRLELDERSELLDLIEVDPGGSEKEQPSGFRDRAHDPKGMLEDGAHFGCPIEGRQDIFASARGCDVRPHIGDELGPPISKLAELQSRVLRDEERVSLVKDAAVPCSEAFGLCLHCGQIIASSFHFDVSSPVIHGGRMT
jgi:hypothetical protein